MLRLADGSSNGTAVGLAEPDGEGSGSETTTTERNTAAHAERAISLTRYVLRAQKLTRWLLLLSLAAWDGSIFSIR